MEELFEIEFLRTKSVEILTIAQAYLTSIDFLGQVAVMAALGAVAYLIGTRVLKAVVRFIPDGWEGYGRRTLLGILAVIAQSGLWLLLAWIALTVATAYDLPSQVLRVAVNLLTAWVVIRAASRVVKDPFLSNALFVIAWGMAALNATGLLGPVLAEINAIKFTVGEREITGIKVLRGIFALILLGWAAMAASAFLGHRIRSIDRLTPTLQILLTKIMQFTLVALAVVFALQIVGIPLTAFAIFGGALGLGIGLGLQRAASNIISGLMLLMDRSIKPGDVISIGETFGWVTSLGGRYVAVRTRNGIEHLIPNEVFITNGVENWSYSNKTVRLKLPLGIAYEEDPHQAIALCVEAARESERVVDTPEPVCLLKGFGDSSVDLELRIWITDPENGVSNAKSDVYLRVWDKFKAAGIQIPFPQRELHMVGPVEIKQAVGSN